MSSVVRLALHRHRVCPFALAGMLAGLMRIQLSRAGNSFLGPDLYNQIFTMPGPLGAVHRHHVHGTCHHIRGVSVALTPDGRKLYSANGLSNDVSVIDTASRRTVNTIRVGDGPWGVAIR